MDDALKHWEHNFAKVNADEMFEEIDKNNNGLIEPEEWDEFWCNVIYKCGHSENYILSEVINYI